LANKMARMIWAMLTKEIDYRDPTISAAAWFSRSAKRDIFGKGSVRSRSSEWAKRSKRSGLGKPVKH
jgi:hypothetical protein